MDGKLEQIKYKGIERNSAEESASIGSAQELFNMRYKDGAWRNVKRKLKLGEYASARKFIGWYSHPATDNQTFISYNETARKVAVINYVTDSQVWIVKRDGTDFVLPATETFNRFGHLENVLILFSNIQMYRFLWVNGKFEYVEFGDIEWTLSKSTVYATTINETTRELAIAKYIEFRSNYIKLGYIEGICAFRIVIELFDGTFFKYSDVKILRAGGNDVSTSVNMQYGLGGYYVRLDTNAGNNSIYFTAYKPFVEISSVPEWLSYYIDLGVIKALHIASTLPIYPYVPEWGASWGENATDVWIPLPEFNPKPLFVRDTDIFYSMYRYTKEMPNLPTIDTIFPYNLGTLIYPEIDTDNFTGNLTTSEYSFLYNGRLHLQQITNTLPIPPIPSNDAYPSGFEQGGDINDPFTWGYYPLYNDNYTPTATYDMYIEVVLKINNKAFVTRRKLENIYKKAYLSTANEETIWIGKDYYYPHASADSVRISMSKDGENFYILQSPERGLPLIGLSTHNLAKQFRDVDIDPNLAKIMYTDQDYAEPILDPWYSLGLDTKNTYTDTWFSGGYAYLKFIPISVPKENIDYATHPSCKLVEEQNGFYTDTNRLQLSELENPFVLPASSSYRFGDINNRISGIEVPREQLTETRFGQFPLYVFTTQGIWVLEQGTDVLYSNMFYLDKYVCNNNNLIKAIQGFVCFSTDEGLYLVSGKSFQELSTSLEGDVDCHIPILNLDALQSFFLDNSDFNFYLSQSEIKQELPYMSICFDYINKEIIFSPTLLYNAGTTKEINYSYVYSIESKSWHKISETFAYFVDTNPAVVGIKYKKGLGKEETFIYTYSFFDMHAEDEYNDAKMYISRPVTFGSMIYKRLEQILVRMNLENLHKDIHGNYIQSPYNFYIFGSLDGKEYKLLQGGETIIAYINDISLRRMFVDCKFFIFAYVCTHEQVEMLGMEVVVKPKFVKTLR